MTAKTRPLPEHGSEARYQGSLNRPGCRCRTCINGWTRAGKRRHLARLQGRPATIPAEPVTKHLALLLSSDMTTGQIAAASGVNPSTIKDHANGNFPTIRRTTAEKILAVRPGQQPSIGFVPALGSIRRCRALYAVGHNADDIAAAHPQLQLRTIDHVIRGDRRHVAAFVHQAIAEAYKALCQQSGNSARAKARASKEGWAGPDYWDHEDFDNPDFEPVTAIDFKRDQIAELRREEIEHLAWSGCDTEEIHQRLGGEVSIGTVRAIVREFRTGQRRNRKAAA